MIKYNNLECEGFIVQSVQEADLGKRNYLILKDVDAPKDTPAHILEALGCTTTIQYNDMDIKAVFSK